jgi:CDP-glucose 4,6-dehydratase
MRAFGAKQPLALRMPQAVRPWQFVLDALNGLLLVAEAACRDPKGFSGAWNFGPPERATATVAEVADMLARDWGAGAAWLAKPDADIPETTHLEIDSSKAVARLGWRPHWPLERAVAPTVAWYRKYGEGHDMAELTAAQIEQYEACQSREAS